MNIFLQPAGESTEKQLQITIRKKENLEKLKKYVTKEQYQELEKLYPEKEINMWGVTFKRENVWDQMQIGDMVLFYGIGRFFKKGIIQYKLHNQELAKNIWGVDKNGFTWEYIFFMDQAKTIDIPLTEFNEVTAYKLTHVQGAMKVTKPGAKEKILQKYQNILDVNYQEIEQKEQKTRIQKLEEEIWHLDIKNAKKDCRIITDQSKSKSERQKVSRNGNRKKKGKNTNLTQSLSSAAKSHLGILGEQYIYKRLGEKDSNLSRRLKLQAKDIEIECYNKDYNGQIDWEDQSIGKGHDILVKFKQTNEEIYLEIKTSLENSKIYTMTGNELRLSKQQRQNYYIIKVDNFRYINNLEQNKIPTIEIIRNPYEIVEQGDQIKEISMYCSKDNLEDER